VGAGCPVRSGARCGMFTVQVAYENVVSSGESIQLHVVVLYILMYITL
jgi:hypothetical protein